MAVKMYELSFGSVLPVMRRAEDILVDLSVAGRATEISKAKIAEIELLIRDGDSLFRQREYDAALNKFRKARAAIYQLLHPEFDVTSFVGRKDVALPQSEALEKSLLDLSARIIDTLRPPSLDPRPIWRDSRDVIPAELKRYTTYGFRESVGIEETIQRASTQGVSLLNDGKPEAAIDIMEDALSRATAPGVQADQALTAALELNLSAAHVQGGDLQKATGFATKALERFRGNKDLVGQAQALHMIGVSKQKAGDATGAKQSFTQAATTFKEASGVSATVPGPVLGPLPPVLTPFISDTAIAAIDATNISPAINAGLVRSLQLTSVNLASRDLKTLQPIAQMDPKKLTFRVPGRADGWGALDLTDDLVKRQQSKSWNIGVPVGDRVAVVAVANGKLASTNQVVDEVYKVRAGVQRYRDLEFHLADTSTTTFYLTHLYAYVLPVKIGDCFHELGQFNKAEEYFLQASTYSFLHKELEATALWNRLAKNALEWGTSLYKSEDIAGAKTQYSKIITEIETVPNSRLYNTAALAVPAGVARGVIQNLAARPLPVANWEITIVILQADIYLQQILQGLDFFGLLLSPIHTFEYLQSVSRAFAQEAIQAEREFVNFKSREEMEAATRRDLETAKAMAQAEVAGRLAQLQAAREDVNAAQRAFDLAKKRRDDAVTQRDQYSASSSAQIWAQAASQAQGMGEDSWYGEISELADKLARGESISGPRGKLAAAYTLWAGRKTQQYEIQKMNDNINELNLAINVAQAQLNGANASARAAEIAFQAALQRAQMASASLNAFDEEFFTPESWSKMANVMRDISRGYLHNAIRIAKLMERAYNFENDTTLNLIKNEYGFNAANAQPGRDIRLLGGDSLLQDIESFTYHAITNKTRKSSRIKDNISLTTDFPAQFEEFRRTGLLSIETDLYEFDRLHPGFYGQRIEAVELEVIGLLPENGLNGTLSAGGVTSYRKKDGTVAKRVHQVDTMALSDFVLRNDVFVYGVETGVRGLFQGLGLGSTWQLHLPKRSNDFDFRRIFDVQMVIYYTAKYDNALRTAVLAKPVRPGELSLLRDFGLRYDFPDSWYSFYLAGATTFAIDRARLPTNQQDFKVKSVNFRVVTKPGVSNQNIDVRVTGPGGVSGTARTDASGVISTASPTLAGLIGKNPISTWKVEVLGGPSLNGAGPVKFDRVYNLQMGLEYTFTNVPEVI
jgi:hypothetical protein